MFEVSLCKMLELEMTFDMQKMEMPQGSTWALWKVQKMSKSEGGREQQMSALAYWWKDHSLGD